MDQVSLQTSSQRWMQAALEAVGHSESLDFAVHHAGVGLEHLLKAYLCSLHPVLVVDAEDWPSLLHAVGHGDRSGVPASHTKSIGLKAAFDHIRKLLRPDATVADQASELVSAARNSVAHIGTHDVRAARAVLATCVRIATPVLTELGVAPRDNFGTRVEARSRHFSPWRHKFRPSRGFSTAVEVACVPVARPSRC